MANKKILLYHRLRSVKTIQDFIDHEYLNIEQQDLFDSNKDRIYKQMTEQDKTQYKDSYGTYPTSGEDLNVNMTLPCPCTLLIDPKFITAELAINQTNLQINEDDFYAFEDEQIQEVKNDNSYSEDLDKRAPSCQIIGWFKNKWFWSSEEKLDTKYAYENITSDIISVNISVGKNGGNFSIRLPHVDVIKRNISFETTDADTFSIMYPRIIPDENILFKDKKENNIYGFENFKRDALRGDKRDYYSTLISSNDLLFISMHHNSATIEQNGKTISSTNKIRDLLTNPSCGNYDMIGLVDEVKIVRDSQGSQIAVDVSGRDLMKIIIEDGSFFFNPSVAVDPSMIFWNDKQRGDILSVSNLGDDINPLQRMIGGGRDVSNMISVFAHKQNMSIEFVLKSVLSQLVNIQVVPNDAFDGFPNRTTFLDLTPKNEE